MTGIGVYPSIAIGRARLLQTGRFAPTGVLLENDVQKEKELKELQRALEASTAEIERIKATLAARKDIEGARILDAHIELLNDPEIREGIIARIRKDGKNANDAVIETVADICRMFAGMDNDYLKARADDIRDVGNRVLRHLKNEKLDAEGGRAEPQILIAEDIPPSALIELDPNEVAGFATQKGGKTPHLAIIARMRGIPAIVGCGNGLDTVREGDLIILDGADGQVLVNPDEATVAAYQDKKAKQAETAIALKALRQLPAKTTDGVLLNLYANIAYPEEMEAVFENGGEGIGLLRTEMLFLNRRALPEEEEQYRFYKDAAIKAHGMPVILRTIDIGGDKQAPYLGLEKEENPFLGYRAIRICLDCKDIFRIQLRAILRASAFGDLRILLPMIVSVSEIEQSKALIEEMKAELADRGIAFRQDIKVGIMIEVPAAAAAADLLAKHVDFFSIGTNDLVQYALAVDRMNEKIKQLYDPFNPGVLRLIHFTIEQGHKCGIDVGMCGEFASDPLAAPLLIGMGLTEFSMSAHSIPLFKQTILNYNYEDAKKVAEAVLQMDNSEDIRQYLQGARR